MMLSRKETRSSGLFYFGAPLVFRIILLPSDSITGDEELDKLRDGANIERFVIQYGMQ